MGEVRRREEMRGEASRLGDEEVKQGQMDLITKVKQAEAKLGCSIKLRQIDAKFRQIEAN